MSDDFIVIVPRDPHYVPSHDVQQRVSAVLARIAPQSEQSTAEASAEIRFFDCGENFERISCPQCSADISLEWWQDRMDDDQEGDGFRLALYTLPCCQSNATLNDLIYDWPQTFGRFRWELQNPNIDELTEKDLADVRAAAGVDLVFIRQHI